MIDPLCFREAWSLQARGKDIHKERRCSGGQPVGGKEKSQVAGHGTACCDKRACAQPSILTLPLFPRAQTKSGSIPPPGLSLHDLPQSFYRLTHLEWPVCLRLLLLLCYRMHTPRAH
jgi:hypothetical protein